MILAHNSVKILGIWKYSLEGEIIPLSNNSNIYYKVYLVLLNCLFRPLQSYVVNNENSCLSSISKEILVLYSVDFLDKDLCKYCNWADLSLYLISFLTIRQEDQS